MKIIQNRERDRIAMMIRGDEEMRNLAIKLLTGGSYFRWTWMTIVFFHAILFILTLTGAVTLCYKFHLGLYWIPLITACTFQAFWSVAYLGVIWRFRKEYNKHMADITRSA